MDNVNLQFLFYGYAVAWLIVAGLVVALIRREKSLHDQVKQLRRLVEERDGAPAPRRDAEVRRT